MDTRLINRLPARHRLRLLRDDVEPATVAIVIHRPEAVVRADLAAVRCSALGTGCSVAAREALTIVDVFFYRFCSRSLRNRAIWLLRLMLLAMILVRRLSTVCVVQQVD